jgi:SH3 domain protein
MSGRRRWLSSAASLLFCMLAVPVASGETVYVGDRFEIGVHESTNIDSVILAVIPSGTPLEVIDRDGEFVQVNTPSGIKGWVDARYVASEKPSVALLDERDQKLADAVRSLGDARAEVEVLRQRVSELQRDAATAAQHSTDIAKPISLVSNEDSLKLKEAKGALEKLEDENQQLRTRITDLQAIQSASEKSLAASAEKAREASTGSVLQAPASAEMRFWTPWQWLLLGSIVLLAFAAGGYVVDWESRRRHGGFRV